MKVYADLRWPAGTGIGVVQRELVRQMPKSLTIEDLRIGVSVGSPYSPFAISKALRNRRPLRGIFWSPGFMPPASTSLPSIVTVHDLTHLRFYSKMHAFYYNRVLRPLYQKITKVVCVSDYTRTEFLRWSGMPEDKVITIHNGVSPLFGIGPSNSPFTFPYVFYPGNHRPYKNTHRLICAFAASKLPRSGIHLVFTGIPQRVLQAHSEALGILELIHFVGEATEQQLVELYRGALLVAFVSLYEGFGLPILEAMTAGVPVITSNTSAMPETAGNAALVVDPYSVDAIANGLNLLTFDQSERDLRIQRGSTRSREFSWNAAASRLSALIKAISPDQVQ